MGTIEVRRQLLTPVNVFTVDPGRQQELVTLLTDATEQAKKNLPGFVSAS